MRIKNFLRTSTNNFKRLGSNSKRKQRWRKPRGRHNKLREKNKGRPRKVEIGYKQDLSGRGKIKGKPVAFVRNMKEADAVKKECIVIIAKMGKKKRNEIIAKLTSKNIEVYSRRKNESQK